VAVGNLWSPFVASMPCPICSPFADVHRAAIQYTSNTPRCALPASHALYSVVPQKLVPAVSPHAPPFVPDLDWQMPPPKPKIPAAPSVGRCRFVHVDWSIAALAPFEGFRSRRPLSPRDADSLKEMQKRRKHSDSVDAIESDAGRGVENDDERAPSMTLSSFHFPLNDCRSDDGDVVAVDDDHDHDHDHRRDDLSE